jgi:hypothetical protein
MPCSATALPNTRRIRSRSTSSTGFFGVRLRPFGRYTTELIANGHRWWLGTFETVELGACTTRSGGGTAARGGSSISPKLRAAKAEFLVPEL